MYQINDDKEKWMATYLCHVELKASCSLRPLQQMLFLSCSFITQAIHVIFAFK